MKSVLGEFSFGVSICRCKGTQSDLGAPFLPGAPFGRRVRGALPSALFVTPTVSGADKNSVWEGPVKDVVSH